MPYSKKVNIYKYTSYRDYLRDSVERLKTEGVFSHRKFAKLAGFGSPNFLLLLIQGKRNLARVGAKKIAKALELDSKETKFFLQLVEANQAKTPSEKVDLTAQLLKHAEFLKAHPMTEEQFLYYRNWYNLIVRELVMMNPSANAQWLASCVQPEISEKQAKESLDLLESIGFIQKRQGAWIVQQKTVLSGNNISNVGLISFHKKMIELAKDSIDSFRAHEREVSAVTVSLSEKQFEAFQQKIRDLKAEILSDSDESGDRVYQFNFQLFPVSRSVGEKK